MFFIDHSVYCLIIVCLLRLGRDNNAYTVVVCLSEPILVMLNTRWITFMKTWSAEPPVVCYLVHHELAIKSSTLYVIQILVCSFQIAGIITRLMSDFVQIVNSVAGVCCVCS